MSGREEHSSQTTQHRAKSESRQFDIGDIDTERPAGDLIFANRFPGPAGRRLAHAQHEKIRQDCQCKDHVVEEDDPMRAGVVEAKEAREGSLIA
ncbi:hypothetical protein D9M70_555630 [compost metagenome]